MAKSVVFSQQIDLLKARRADAEPLPKDSAAYTSSESFKSRSLNHNKSEARCWNHHLSVDSRNQQSSPLKEASRSKQTTTISLGTARPSAEFYPWESIGMSCLDAGNINPSPISMSCAKGEAEYDLASALNYGFSAGSPQSVRFITEHIEMIHNPPYRNWSSCLTCGTTSAIEMSLRIFCNSGDSILVEKYTYTGTILAAKAQGVKTIGVEMDEFGLCPDSLNQLLTSWDNTKGPKPHVLYTIPTGQNPTSVTQPLERRNAIYTLAEKHDLIVIEDDPYYFLQLQDNKSTNSKPAQEYLQNLLPSYLSLDTSGRVVRLDSTSKILSPGLRLGWLTACSQITDLFLAYSEVSVLSPSGLSQVLVYKLLDQTWGHQGFIQWLSRLSFQYSQRLHILDEACRNYIPRNICQWHLPEAGMFVWVSVDTSLHPQAPSDASDKEFCLSVEDKIYEYCKEQGVLISKGSWFITDTNLVKEVCFRLTFAAAEEGTLAEGIKVLGAAVTAEFHVC